MVQRIWRLQGVEGNTGDIGEFLLPNPRRKGGSKVKLFVWSDFSITLQPGLLFFKSSTMEMLRICL